MEYKEGYELKDDEYLLKVHTHKFESGGIPTGFLTKFNKDGSMPVAFKNWPGYYQKLGDTELPVTIHSETFKEGWKVFSWRFGQSQNWARMIHPNGFTLEIYLTNFLDLMLSNVIMNGKIQGKFKWEANKLIPEILVYKSYIM